MDRKILDLIEDESKKRIISRLKTDFPQLEDDVLLKIYTTSVSIRQSNVQKRGADLEKVIETLLEHSNIPFKSQVVIDKTGYIVDGMKSCHHKLDIVVGFDIKPGKFIGECIVLSCKTSSRERWTQDSEWSLTSPPILYMLITLSDDYPPSGRFSESTQRKIITPKAKRKDDREFKLGLSDIVPEVAINLCKCITSTTAAHGVGA